MLVSSILALILLMSACADLNNLLNMFNEPSVTYVSGSEDDSPDVVEKDEEGHVIRLSHYNGEGKLIFVHTQTWENDRIINKKSFDDKGNQTASIDYEYDERGNNTVSSWFFWNTGDLMKVERVYDEYDRMIESTGYGTKTVSTNKTYLEYDDSNGDHPKNYCKKTYYPSYPGNRYYVTTFDYDSDGNLIKATTVDKDGNLSSYELYTYSDGKLMEYTSYDEEGKPSYTYKYEYDENGKRIKELRYDSDGNLVGVDY